MPVLSPVGVEVLERWQRRALLAELELFNAGLRSRDPRVTYGDDAWLLATLAHKDGRAMHVDDLAAARARLEG